MSTRAKASPTPGSELAALLGVAAVGVLTFSGVRALLILRNGADLAGLSAFDFAQIFVVGARLDAAFLAFVLFPAVAMLLLPSVIRAPALRYYVPTVVIFVGLAAASEIGFFDYYGFRANYLVLEHIGEPEVLRTALRGHVSLLGLVVAGVAIAGGVAGVRLLRSCAERTRFAASGTTFVRWMAPALLLVLLFVVARGTLDHRPINPSLASIGANRVVNEISGSGVFNVAYEGFRWRRRSEEKLEQLHELLPAAEATARTEHLLGVAGPFTRDSRNPFVRDVSGPAPGLEGQPANVVVVVMESFTGRLVGALGGEPALSPEFDALAAQGVLLTHCYATGERTVQGLEAIVSSFPPLPGVSVIRRAEAQTGFATLASLLRARGYETLFLYGGQGIFDHMRGFFLGNGYDTFIEERDMAQVDFRGSWGVSDEDLFRRANREFQRRHESETPFFATILTVSLHSPWEFPPGRAAELATSVNVPRGFEREELANFLYADYAIGQFMREARTLSYADDTLFVFVGDHGVHLRGRELLPSEEYRVPALFLQPGTLSPARIDSVASQTDVAPTIMGVLGGDYRSPFFGRDLLRSPDSEGLAILVYGKRHYGVRRADRLTVLQSGGRSRAYRIPRRGAPVPVPETPAHVEDGRDGLAVVQAAEGLVRTSRFTEEPDPYRLVGQRLPAAP